MIPFGRDEQFHPDRVGSFFCTGGIPLYPDEIFPSNSFNPPKQDENTCLLRKIKRKCKNRSKLTPGGKLSTLAEMNLIPPCNHRVKSVPVGQVKISSQ